MSERYSHRNPPPFPCGEVVSRLVQTLPLPWIQLFSPPCGGDRGRKRKNPLAPVVWKMRRLLREAAGEGGWEEVVRALRVLAERGPELEKALVAWVSLVEGLVQSAETRRPGRNKGVLKSLEVKAVIRRLYRARRIDIPQIPDWLEPLVVDVVVDWSIDAVVFMTKRQGLWVDEAPTVEGKMASAMLTLWEWTSVLLAPIGRVFGRIYRFYSDLYWKSIPLSPAVEQAMEQLAQVDLSGQQPLGQTAAEVLTWVAANKDRIIASTELIFAAVHEAERFVDLHGEDKKRYARDLVRAVLSEMGLETDRGLMGILIMAAVDSGIEIAVHLLNKRGAFQSGSKQNGSGDEPPAHGDPRHDGRRQGHHERASPPPQPECFPINSPHMKMTIQSFYDKNYLEHVCIKPERQVHSTPLFFMHGAYHGVFCWQLFFERFLSLGYEVHAISLPGHQSSSMAKRSINDYSLADYVEAMAGVVQSIDPPPIIISHSLGGALAQIYLADNTRIPGAIFMSSIPAHGLWRSGLKTFLHFPLLSLKRAILYNSFYFIDSRRFVRTAFFSKDPDIIYYPFMQRLSVESTRASLPLVFGGPLHPEKIRCPTLVMVGSRDFPFSVEEERDLAKRMRGDFKVMPGRPHDMMLTQGWQEVADVMDQWIQEKGLGGGAAGCPSAV